MWYHKLLVAAAALSIGLFSVGCGSPGLTVVPTASPRSISPPTRAVSPSYASTPAPPTITRELAPRTFTYTPFKAASSTVPAMPSRILTLAVAHDERDIAAQTLGYSSLDAFMVAFEIPKEVKPRIFVCPKEETWCVSAVEGSGPYFHFRNVSGCQQDGKQANGISGIPAGFDGTVRGFTIRPCPTLTSRPAGLPPLKYSAHDLNGWEVVLGDGIYAAPGEPPVTLSDVETAHFGDRSELQANLSARHITGHNVTFKRVINEEALKYVHSAQYQFRLPRLPDPTSAGLNGQTVEGHLAIWDGRPGARLDAIVGWQWIVNPELAEYGDLRMWVGPDPGHWKKVGRVRPDSAWHTVMLRLDKAQERGRIAFDDQVYEDALTLMSRPEWGPEVAARFAAEAISVNPNISGPGSFHRVEFRDWVWSWM